MLYCYIINQAYTGMRLREAVKAEQNQKSFMSEIMKVPPGKEIVIPAQAGIQHKILKLDSR